MRKAALFLVVTLLFFACGSHVLLSLIISFPDEPAKEATKSLRIFVLIADAGVDCTALLAGELQPGGDGARIESTIEFPWPAPTGERHLDAGQGKRLFYAAAYDGEGKKILHGCTAAEVGAASGNSVRVELDWLCRAGPDVCDGVDNDCDGSTDEDGAADCRDDGVFCNGEEYCGGKVGCAHLGDPCPGNCDEANRRCSGCGDGTVNAGAPEQCDPGPPQNDHCCDPTICRWVGAGQPDPQGFCSGATECQRNACDGSGGCTTINREAGFPCGDQAVPCRFNDSCDGNGNCLDNGMAEDGTECGARSCSDRRWLRQTCKAGYCTGSEVLDTCDDQNECTENLCAAASGCYYQPVSNGTLCTSDGIFCNGVESCQAGICTSPGNPCPNPEDCDEWSDKCGTCGDGDVNSTLGEECDPGAPARNHCCDLGTCRWVGAGSPDPQGFCSGAPACQREVCNGSGGCLRVNLDDGTPCGDSADTECDNPDTCLDGVCRPNYEQSGAPCGNLATTACSNPDTCDGNGFCLPNHLPAGSEGNIEGVCPVCQDCDGNGSCAPVDAGQTDVGCNASADECSDAYRCDGSGLCVFGHLPAGTLCMGSDGDECNSWCDGEGKCQEPVAVPDHTACKNSTGICCSQQCAIGWQCCGDADCDDGNDCTQDACQLADPRTCSNTCQSPSCMILDVASPAQAGVPATLSINMCPATRNVGQFVCLSNRNQQVLVEEHFETGYGDFLPYGTVSRTAGAQSPNTYARWGRSGDTHGVRICGNAAQIGSIVNTEGHSDIGLAFSIASDGLDDGESLLVEYSANGGETFRALASVGDTVQRPHQDFFFILPPDADNNSGLYIIFYTLGGATGDCDFVDDVYVFDLPPMTPVQTLLSADFETGFLPFTEYDPEGNDVSLVIDGANLVVEIVDNTGANITSPAIDTTGVDPHNMIVVAWDWKATPDIMEGPDDYALLMYSLDDGVNWLPLSTIGLSYAPTVLTRYRAVLPCEAIGITNLRLQFIVPTSADNAQTEGIRVDNVSVVEYLPSWAADRIGTFVDSGGGIYSSSVTSSVPGNAQIRCRYACGTEAMWSNVDSVTFNP